jgi:prefoldin alpha subunit
MTDQERAEQLVSAYQQYQAQIDMLMRELSLAQLSLDGLDRAINAAKGLESASEGQEIMVPIGSGSYIHARITSKDKVVLNVGAGVAIEKSPVDAIASLQVRRSDIAEGTKKVSELIARLQEEMGKIQGALEGYQAQAGSEGLV